MDEKELTPETNTPEVVNETEIIIEDEKTLKKDKRILFM